MPCHAIWGRMNRMSSMKMADQNTSVSTANLNSHAEPEGENPLSVSSPFFKQSFFFSFVILQ